MSFDVVMLFTKKKIRFWLKICLS